MRRAIALRGFDLLLRLSYVHQNTSNAKTRLTFLQVTAQVSVGKPMLEVSGKQNFSQGSMKENQSAAAVRNGAGDAIRE